MACRIVFVVVSVYHYAEIAVSATVATSDHAQLSLFH